MGRLVQSKYHQDSRERERGGGGRGGERERERLKMDEKFEAYTRNK
jgi:hypothetical protein